MLAATPITEAELATIFDVAMPRSSDAMQWVDMMDVADWSDVDVRRRAFKSLVAAGASKQLTAAGHVFTFADGSTLTVTRHGVSF